MELIYGKNVVMEALKANHKFYNLYLLRERNLKDIEKLAIEKQVNISYIEKKEMDSLTKGLHQGVVAKVEDYQYYDLDTALRLTKKEKPIFLMLDSLEDPHNLGAILRTCDAASVDGIIISKNRSVKLNSTVAKVSTGAIEHVKVIEVTNLNQTIKKLKEKGFWIVTAEKTSNSLKYDQVDYDMPIVLVIGSEGKGVSRLLLESSDFVVEIPMLGHVNSLNASVSAAILIYEIIKTR